MKVRQSRRVTTIVLLLAWAITEISAQSPALPQQQPALLQPNSRTEFVEGKTVVEEVIFRGLDGPDAEAPDGQRSIYESDVRFLLRKNRADVSAGEPLDLARTESAIRLLKEYLADAGHFEAVVTAFGEMLSPNRMRLVFSVERGEPTRISEIHFAGNVNFAADELTEALISCLGEKWGVYDLRHIDYCAQKDLRRFMYSKGYFAARMGKPEQRQVRGAIEITFQISEGPRFRLGEVRIVGANALSEDQILEQLGQTTGDIADGRNLQDFVYERLQRLYADKGHMLYNAEFEPDMIPPADEGLDGTVNVRISIDEGPLMRISKIEILGVDKETESTLLRGFLQKIGTPFSQTKFEEDIRKLNETERFDPVDKYDQNVELAVYEESKDVVIRIRLRPRSE